MEQTELRDQLRSALGGAYRIEGEIGGGGMSRVFVATESALERRVVVKVLPPELWGSLSVDRFQREIQLAASLVHPHIVPLLSAGEIEGLPFYTMPLVDGESLRAKLRREWRLPVDEAIRLTREMAAALDYAHRRGVVHRDVKPENVLLHDGHALLTDFGIARAISRASAGGRLTEVGIVLGTPMYMSPEQAVGDRDLDGRSDLYALACVTYEMLAGGPPFSGSTSQGIMVRHVVEPPPSLSAVREDVPPEVEAAVMRALAKAPEARFRSAAEYARALSAPQTSVVVVSGPYRLPALPTSAPVGRDILVAVLPFENMSSEPENEYFSDGITEDIIVQLSKVRGLRVMSRSSVMRFKRTDRPLREIACDLGASHVVQGSVRRAGSRLRIVAQLVDPELDEQLWAETYDREMTDVFAIQSEVALHIAELLKAQLSPTDRSRLARKPTDDLEAYNLYLLARHYYNKVSPADFEKALDYYKRAIERDPRFARAHASLAEALIYLGLGYWGVRPHDVYPEVLRSATLALELDPQVAEAHASLGVYHEWYRFDWARAEPELEQAVDLNPSSPMIRMYRALHLAAHRRFDEAIVERDQACQLDPGAMVIRGNATWVLYLAGRSDDAIAEARGLRELEPESAYAAFTQGLVCAQGGDPEEAIGAFRDAVALSGEATLYLIMLAYGLAVAGRAGEARTLLRRIEERARTEYVWPMGLAMAAAHLGDHNAAMRHLEQAYEDRVGWLPMIGCEPALDVLRGHRRFRTLAARIGPPSGPTARTRERPT